MAATFRFKMMTSHSEGRRMFRAKKGYIGLAPNLAAEGTGSSLLKGVELHSSCGGLTTEGSER